MYTKNSLIRMKNFILLFSISLVVSSLGSFLKAQEQEEVETPTPEATPAMEAPSVLATTDGEYPDLRVEVKELKRNSGGTVTLKFAVFNDSDKNFSFGSKLASGDFGHDVSGVNLVDVVGKKKYLVIVDSKKKCLCSNNPRKIEAKSGSNLWAKFPAPPENVEKITVEIPHFTPMDDVPISK